jgi:hypothetical protein
MSSPNKSVDLNRGMYEQPHAWKYAHGDNKARIDKTTAADPY